MSKEKGLHDGHRDRLRKRFISDGPDKFYDHQIVELLLFYGIPRKDTNNIAHKLLNRFGSFSAMFDAPLDSLQECGITYNTAVLLKLIPALCSRYYQDKYQQKVKLADDNEDIEEFIKPYFIGQNEEQVLLLLLDAKGKRLFCDIVNKGTTSASNVNIKKILQLSVQHKATGVIIAHNHPSGSNMPSDDDIEMTKKLAKSLRTVGALLLDHYIIADMNCRSLSSMDEYWDIFF